MSFGKNLRRLREERGIERKILAQTFEMPYNTLKNYENDEREPGHSFIIKVAQYFGVTTDFLLDNDLTSVGNTLSILKVADKKISDEALEVAEAYDNADLKNKNIARQVLDLPPLPTAIGKNMEAGVEFDIEQELADYRRELEAEQKGRTSAAFDDTKGA